jgi:hypothetical protein
MRAFLCGSLALLVLFAAGCGGSGPLQAKGRVVKAGQPFVLGKGEGLRMIFEPLEGGSKGHYDSYAAEFQPTSGRFQVKGKDGKGLPPGKYRVSLEHMKDRSDLFGGRFLGTKSPFTVEVTRSGGDLVVDLDKASSDQ